MSVLVFFFLLVIVVCGCDGFAVLHDVLQP